MTYISRKTRLFLPALSDDCEKLHEKLCILRFLDLNGDPRAWSISCFDRHQHLMDVINCGIRNIFTNDESTTSVYKTNKEDIVTRTASAATTAVSSKSNLNLRQMPNEPSRSNEYLNEKCALEEIANILGRNPLNSTIKSTTRIRPRQTTLRIEPRRFIEIHLPPPTSPIPFTYEDIIENVKYLKNEHDQRLLLRTRASRFQNEDEMHRHLNLVEKQLYEYQQLNRNLQERLNRLQSCIISQENEIRRLTKLRAATGDGDSKVPPDGVKVTIKQKMLSNYPSYE